MSRSTTSRVAPKPRRGVGDRGLRIPATRAARSFSDLLNRVHYRGERFLVERGGETICEMGPARPHRFTTADLVDLLQSLPPVDKRFWTEIEAAAKHQPKLPKSPWER